MHAKIIFFLKFSLLYKNTTWFFSFERFGRMHGNKSFFLFFFWKPGIFNTEFLFLRYKNTDQYLLKWRRKIRGKITIFKNIYNNKKNTKNKKGEKNEMDWAVLAQLQGWTQPSRVGWADVPACNKKGLGWCSSPQEKERNPWLVTVREHSNQLIN